MRKAAIFLILIASFQVFETASAAVIRYWLRYQPYRDEYRMDFTWPTGTTSYRAWFIARSDGKIYELFFNSRPTGILWLTCNGTYNVDFYNSQGELIGFFRDIITTEIQNPKCSSYEGQEGQDDLNARSIDNRDGTHDLFWDRIPGAVRYEIYKDGELIGNTPGTSYKVIGDGSISIVARDENGDIIGESHLHVPKLNDVENCITCQTLADLLSCPEWDVYMGELTQAIRNALPTLPEWRQIADVFVDAFDEYFGDVPPVPSVGEIGSRITPPLPDLDTDVPEADISPIVDDAYNQPLEFDITTGPEIPVVDESEPIEIYEPDAFIESDGPGVMVFPRDPRNHSGGIKEPDKFNSPYPTPQPSPTDPGEIPPNDMPTPGGTTGTIPIPTDPGGIIPIPKK